MVMWDVVGAAVALYYLSLRRSYGTLLRTPAMFEDEVRRRTAEQVEHERELLTQAEELAGAGSWERDLRTGAVTWSAGMYRIRGYEQGEEPAAFENPKADVHPDDIERVEREFAVDGPQRRRPREPTASCGPTAACVISRRARASSATPTARPPAWSARASTSRSARRWSSRATSAERELRERERMLSEAEERFRGAFENAPIGMALVGLDGRLLQVNAVLCEITGLDRDWLQRLELSQLSEREDVRADDEALIRMTHGELDRYSTEKRFVRPDGRTVWVQLQVTLLRDRQGGPVRFIAQIQDISGRRRDEEQLRHMANHDPLTGLLNRRSFERALSNQLAHVRRYGTSSALLFIDLDDFKYVNDSLGHAEGDKLIVRVAETLTAELRETDVLARLGGDEFAVLLPHAEPAHARVVADKLLRQIAGLQVSMNGHGAASLTASAGIAVLDSSFRPPTTSSSRPTSRCTTPRRRARTATCSYRTDGDYEPRIKARMAWLERIKRALLDGGAGFVLYAQPIVDVQSGEIVQHELLVRLVGEDGELIAPGTFLPVAERFDLIQELDRVVIARAIDALGDDARSTISSVAVNVSAKSLADPALPDFIEGALRDAGRRSGARVLRDHRDRRDLEHPARAALRRAPRERSAASSRSTTSAPATAASTTSSTCPSTT